ncbi:MAG TPA: hypothetical protein VD962_07220 [Rubricoccaceae bacterium]|nr:hypothetical protein [Rubricoccaceae bacterium]
MGALPETPVRLLLVGLLLTTAACRRAAPERPPSDALERRTSPADYSGLAWVGADTFLVVHDAKVPEELDRPRVGLAVLPPAGGPVVWHALDVAWPASHGPAHDLESVARIPGTRSFLLAESGDGATPHQHLFVAELGRTTLRITAVARWPVPVEDVEGIATAEVGGALYFLYAERAHGRDTTQLAWAPMRRTPLSFGAFTSVPFMSPDPRGPSARPVSALEVDRLGRLYVGSAYDPDRDSGPFRSVVWEVGTFGLTRQGRPSLTLDDEPVRRGTLDGLKVESVAVREGATGPMELLVGTDDEDYGAVLRVLPPPLPPR